MADDLVVERQQDERAKQRHRQQEVRRRGRGETTPTEQRQVDQRTAATRERVPDEQDKQRRADSRDRRSSRVEATRIACLGHAVEEERDPRRQQHEATQIKALAELRLGLGQQPDGRQQGERADGQVEVEDPAPAGRVDDRPAEHRPEHRCEQHRHADHAHHPPHPLRPRGLGENRLANRQDHPRAEPLHDPERDQRLERPGRAGKHRADQKEQKRPQPDALGAEAFARPAGQRDDAREGQHVAGDDPLDGRDRRVEGAAQCRNGDVDDSDLAVQRCPAHTYDLSLIVHRTHLRSNSTG